MQVFPIATPKNGQSIRPNKHNIIIVDLSGSMSWATDDLAKDTIERINNLPDGDYLSLAYFSGEGDHRWLIKGIKIDNNNKSTVAKIIKENFHSRNTTCFSEVLATSEQVIKDIAPFSNVVSLAFMSDGHPVVSSLTKETKAIFQALDTIKGQLSDAVVVGYGDYYNRELLSQMAQAMGASFTHAQHINVFGQEFEKASKRKSGRRIKVSVPKNTTVVFTVQDDGVSTLEVKDGAVVAPESAKVVAIADTKPETTPLSANDDLESNLYAGALALTQVGKNDRALEIIGQLGDVAIANTLGSALTNDEIGKAEAMLKAALRDPKLRFLQGKKIGCVPKDDAFDILDCLQLLQQDKDARFYPYHPAFDYKRVGRKSKPKGDFPKFKANDMLGVSFSRLVWHDKKLNLSVGIQIDGEVELRDGYDKINLTSPYETSIFRSYALVANGFPNVRILPASVSKETFEKLLVEGVIGKNGSWDKDKIFMLHLNSLPVVNRMKSRGKKSAKDLALKAVKSTILAGKLKGYRAVLSELDPEKEWKKPLDLTDDQLKFLADNGIVNSYYAPPMEQEAPTDVISVREFEIAIAKFSTFPGVKTVREQQQKGKFTPSGEIVYSALKDANDNKPQDRLEAIDWVHDKITLASSERHKLQKEIQAAKFALVLGNTWFDDLSRSEPKLTAEVDGKTYDVIFNLETVEEKI